MALIEKVGAPGLRVMNNDAVNEFENCSRNSLGDDDSYEMADSLIDYNPLYGNRSNFIKLITLPLALG